MMRRKNTSRRVHAFSSVSIRSDEIAATDMALSRDAAWDIGIGDRDRERAFIENSWTLGAVKSIGPLPWFSHFLRRIRHSCGRAKVWWREDCKMVGLGTV